MKAPFSSYLQQLRPRLKTLLELLSDQYDYVSILSTDSVGLNVRVSTRVSSISDQTMTTERGTVVRVYKNGLYSEYAFNRFQGTPKAMAEEITQALDAQLRLLRESGTSIYDTPALPDEPLELFVEKETELLPEKADVKSIVDQFTGLVEKAAQLCPEVVDTNVTGQSTHVCKTFLSANRDLSQSYVYSEASIVVAVGRDGESKFDYNGVSGCCGPELFRQLDDVLEKTVYGARELLDAKRMVPGEYPIITSPEVTGLIAHEAFGHGVEMDMFVKGRALGKEYIGKRVASDLVTMHEGALCAENVTSYAFDDEGTLAGDVIEIENGILRNGICDALSAMRLGTTPTGNGKRENYQHKVYTRMTNTIFDSGKDSLEDMIASVDYGFLLEGMESGMEDPKHWGIQCIITRGREIRDGKLTGNVFAPVILTGYVPDLLGNISMASPDREVFGNGGCGKGYKEWVKVSDGGPYLKTIGRLG